MKRVRLIAEARKEFLSEVEYYEKARPGFGRRFSQVIEAAFLRASSLPNSGAPAAAGNRRIGVKGFPFSVVYREMSDEIIVIAIAHDRRLPGYWIARIR